MSTYEQTRPARANLMGRLIPLGFVVAIIGVTAWFASGDLRRGYGALELHPHAPNLALLAQAPIAVQLHLVAAVSAFLLGLMQFALPKGTGLHRTTGWIWVVLIATAAVSSLFIRMVNHGAFSFIHILSGWTLVVLPMAVYAARRGDIARHRGRMTGIFIGGLLIAGTLAFMPGRLMWRLFLGD